MARRVTQTVDQPDSMKALRRALGAWLKERREAAGLTQADLADRLGLRYYSFISQVENGIGRIPQDLYAPWAGALSLEPKAFALTVLQYLEPGLHSLLMQPAGGSAAQKTRKSDPKRSPSRKPFGTES